MSEHGGAREENTLLEGQKRLELALEAAELGTWEVDLPAGVVTASEKTCAMFDFDTARPRVEDWIARLHPDDRERVSAELERAISGPSRYDTEYRVIGRDGFTRWVLAKAVPVTDGERGTTRLIGVAQDVTARKQAEEQNQQLLPAVEEEKDRLSALIAGIDDEIWLADAEGAFTLANPSAIREFGLAGAGKVEIDKFAASLEVLRPDGSRRPIEETPSLRALKGEVVRNQEEIIRTPGTGQLRHREVSAAPVKDARGKTIGSVAVVRDITERKRVEQALRNSALEAQRKRAEIEATYNAAPVGLCILDTDLRFVRVNTRFAEANGWPAAAHIGKTPSELDPDMGPAAEKALRHVLETGEPLLDLEVAGVTAAAPGVPRIWIEHWFPLKDGDGRIVGVSIASEDVTERKRAAAQLSRTQRTFSELVERASFGIYVVDSQFRIAHMNAGSQNGAFRNVSPVIGGDFAEAMRILWPERVAEEIISVFRHTLETGEPYYSPPFTHPRHDVEMVESYEWELHRMTLPDGQHGVVCYYFDSTKLREAEEALRESRRKYQALIETTGDFIWEMDTQGRYTYCSPQMESLWGFKPEEMIGKTPFDLMPPEESHRAAEAFAGVVKSPRPFTGMEMASYDHQGRVIFIEIGGVPFFDHDGSLLGFRGITRDITGRRQAEESLRRSEQLYRAIVESIDYGVWVCAPDGRNTYASESFLRLVGMTQEQCSNFGWGDVLHPEDAERTIAAWKECVRTEGIWEREHRFRGVDGKWHPILARGVPVRDGQGRILLQRRVLGRFENAVAYLLCSKELLPTASMEHCQATRNCKSLISTACSDALGSGFSRSRDQRKSAQTTVWSEAPGAWRGPTSTSQIAQDATSGRVARMWSMRQPQLLANAFRK